MSYKLIKFEKDYADEFDVYGFRIMSNLELLEYLAEARKVSYPTEHYFGTNECIEFHNFKDVEDSFSIENLSGEQAQIISDKLGDNFGWFPNFGDY